MECATGLTDDEFDELLARLREEGVEGCPPILGLSGSLRATVMYMRHNSIVRAMIGERLGVCRPIAPAGHQGDYGGDLSDSGGSSAHGRGDAPGLRPSWWTTALYLPCWDWRDRRDLWSVKHGRAGMNDPDPGSCPMEGSCGPWGPYPGSMHDVAAPGAFRAAGGNGSLRVDRRKGIRGKGDDHSA